MTEPALAQEQAPAPPADDQRVPYDRFKQVNDERQALASQVEELAQWKATQEAKSMSDLEAAQKAAQDASVRADKAEQRAVKLERTQLVRQAAAAAGFTDPDDAVAFLDAKLADLDDSDKAKAAVADLAERKAHLIASGDAPPPRPAGMGSLTNGHSTPPAAPTDPNAEPDKAGLGAELMAGLFGRKA